MIDNHPSTLRDTYVIVDNCSAHVLDSETMGSFTKIKIIGYRILTGHNDPPNGNYREEVLVTLHVICLYLHQSIALINSSNWLEIDLPYSK